MASSMPARSLHVIRRVVEQRIKQMKLSDYVVQFLADLGVRHVFAVQGGAVAHLIDSTAKNPNIDYICVGHEQAGSIAVHGYAAKAQGFGCAFATTGPGIINMINGVSCLYYDSMPSIFIGGQVTTARYRAEELGVRQLGFQESPHADLMRPVTKYAATVTNSADIRYELEKAVHIAKEGRPGPVFLDICDDVQREDIDPEGLRAYMPVSKINGASRPLDQIAADVMEMIGSAERPMLVYGAGIRLANAADAAVRLGESLGIPMAQSWAALDLLPNDHPLNAGGFGVHSPRSGNFAVQNTDLLVAVGIRLSQHQTGTPFTTFARGAKKVVVDIDTAELGKFAKLDAPIDLPVHADAGEFLRSLSGQLDQQSVPDFSAWAARVADWRSRYPAHAEVRKATDAVDPHTFMQRLSAQAKEGDIILGDVGATLSWTFQSFALKQDQRLLTSFNNHTMGYALPAAIGASLANPDRTVISLNGDGGFMMNIQELGVAAKHNLPIRTIIMNNHGYGVIQQTQDDYFDSRYNGTTPDSGLMDPDLGKIAEGFGLPVVTIRNESEIDCGLSDLFSHNGPSFAVVEVDPTARIAPAVVGGRPIEDISPLLPRDEFESNMIVPPLS